MDAFAIHSAIPVPVLAKRGSCERNSQKSSSDPRPAENFGAKSGVGLRGPSHRTSSDSCITPQFETLGKQTIHARLIHDKHEEVGFRKSPFSPGTMIKHCPLSRSCWGVDLSGASMIFRKASAAAARALVVSGWAALRRPAAEIKIAMNLRMGVTSDQNTKRPPPTRRPRWKARRGCC
jgi:hypothetical protein